MRNKLILAILCFCLINTAAAQLSEYEIKNQAIVLDFYNKVINEKDFAAASVYLGSWYTQHNPAVKDGPEGLAELVTMLKEKYPNTHSTIKRVFTQGDYVILHVFSQREVNDSGRAIIDIFRLENEKIVEHWDVIQNVPSESQNNNGMF